MKATLNALAGAGLPALGVKRPWLVTVMNLLIAIAGCLLYTSDAADDQ